MHKIIKNVYKGTKPMQNCLIIINKNAGSSKKISFGKVEKCLGDDYRYKRCTIPDDEIENFSAYDAVAVCGGDGTLASILEKACDMPLKVFYFPVGTLNDKAKAERYSHLKAKCPSCNEEKGKAKPIVVGKCARLIEEDGYITEECDKSLFSYVFAAGSFTPIGYTSDVKEKQKFGALAYVSKVVEEYKPHRIKATIATDKKTYDGEFSLIMFLKSPRCFGFHFNKAYDGESMSGHVLAIRSPKHKGALGYIEMFFPFFRAFFMGLKKERDKGSLIFKKIYSANLTLSEDVDFCKDGEKYMLKKGRYKISFRRSLCDFCVIEKF